MRKFYLGAFGLLVMASCSQDETVGVNHDGDEITFSVVTNSIDEDHITGSSGNWTNQSGTRYWPETSVDFYAHVNDNGTYQWSVSEGKATAKFVDFTVSQTGPDNINQQVDLMYAVKTNQTKTNGTVSLNFRHALSQIVFQAKNTNANLYVEIAGVKVANVGNKNTFTFPSANTDNNIAHTDYDTNGNGVYEDTELDNSITYDASWGSWASLTSGTTIYEVDFAQKTPVAGDSKLVSLTTKNDENEEFNSKALLLLPQTTTAWAPTTTSPIPTENNTGSYFLVDCVIYNVAGGSYADGDVCLWGEKNADTGKWGTKELAIPVAFNWEQGKKYVYTFVFGEGNGGYDPDPDPDPENPEPVLVPIKFEIFVDEFVPVNGGEIESGVPGAGE